MFANLISVILPVYNAERTVAEAIDSILKQTYANFELIIINDGSKDRSEEVILEFRDERIKYYSNNGNKGLIYTLNKGIELASGKYIARMDADDIAIFERFEEQIKLMEEHPDTIVCGTLIKAFGNSKAQNFKYIAPESSEAIKRRMIIESPIAHPTAMIRRDVLIDNDIRYNEDYPYVEDYKLWIDLASLGAFYNIQKVLLLYRLSDTQITQKGNIKQRVNGKKCRREYLCSFIQDEKIAKCIQEGEMQLSTLSLLKKDNYPLELFKVLYLSLPQYKMKEFIYFIFSLDCLRFDFMTNLAILKRFIKGKNAIL